MGNQDDFEARSQMHLASTFAGIGFGNAGVHLCHGLSYSIAGGAKRFNPDGYEKDHAIIPHGLSVVITAPAVLILPLLCAPRDILMPLNFWVPKSETQKKADAGKITADVMRKFMEDMKVPDGLEALNFTKDDIGTLVKGALPQDRVNKLAPRLQTEEDLTSLYENSLRVY